MNLHPSRLPRYRGAAPIQHTLLNGDTETAVSVIELSKQKFDHGRILHQQRVTLTPDDDFVTLRQRLAVQGGQAVAHTLQHWDTLRTTAVEQANTGYAAS